MCMLLCVLQLNALKLLLRYTSKSKSKQIQIQKRKKQNTSKWERQLLEHLKTCRNHKEKHDYKLVL